MPSVTRPEMTHAELRSTSGSFLNLRFDTEADARAFASRAIRSADCRRVVLRRNGVEIHTYVPSESSEA